MKRTCFPFLVMALMLASCAGKQQESGEVIRPVKLTTVQAYGSFSKDFTGIVVAEQFSKLTFKVSGALVKMGVEEGQALKKGELIAAIDTRDYDLTVEANKAAYLTAKYQLERFERLLKIEAVSQQDYETAVANHTKAKSAYESALNNLSDTRLVAPFDGFVQEKYVENFQKVQPGEAIIKLVNPSILNIKFTLPENDMALVKTLDRLEVVFENQSSQPFKAKIKEYVDASPDGSGIPVTATIDDPAFETIKKNIAPGFSCQVKIFHSNAADGVNFIVPVTSVFKDLKTEELSVWVYNESTQTVQQKPVQAGKLVENDQMTILSGIQEGQKIVTAGVFNLYEGQKVNVLAD